MVSFNGKSSSRDNDEQGIGSSSQSINSGSELSDSDAMGTKGEVSIIDVIIICLIANLGSFLFGYDQGSTSWIISAWDISA